jgi:hypothetical protein
MDKLKAGFASYIGSAFWWLCDKLWGDRLFSVVKPMIPDWAVAGVTLTETLRYAQTWVPPVLLFVLGTVFFVGERRRVNALISAKTAPTDKVTSELSSQRKALKEDIWNLIEEGVYLRDEGIKTKTPGAWRPKCLAWESRLINQVKLLSSDLARLLKPLNDCDPTKENEKVVAGGKFHQMDVNAVSTIIRILRAELPNIEA